MTEHTKFFIVFIRYSKKFILLLLMVIGQLASAQLVGKVSNEKGEPLPYVNIYLENSNIGTTSNDNGNFELTLPGEDSYRVIFQYLGYTTIESVVDGANQPITVQITLMEESVSLDEVIIATNEDPAYRIIRKTIGQRKANLDRISRYEADFYSRGLWRVDSIPEKVLGQEIGDFNGQLDSTRTGIIYLSETISKIAYRNPDDFKERIIASKVSGNDNGFSFNSAQDANFSFYQNSIDLNASIVSPIGASAMGYYKYVLDGVFYEGSKLINKISVIPRRPNDRVWKGTIYIVEDDWQLYGVDLTTTGAAIQLPFIKELVFKQSFKFEPVYNSWIKRSQTIDFSFGFLGVNGDGRFIAVYSNYIFDPDFNRKSFTNEVLSFEPEANKKDSIYWDEIRPVPLTNEELQDYIQKDSIQTLRKSEKYLDSIDAVKNRIKLTDPIFGYVYRNSFDKWNIRYTGPVPGVNFNTVQGWNAGIDIRAVKSYDENSMRWVSMFSRISYGFSDERVRINGGIIKNFNRTNRLRLALSGGSEVVQFNQSRPISPIVNSIASLFFERNYMKVYELNYARFTYSQEIINGLRASASVGYEERVPLVNTSNYVTFPNSDVDYTSNNPLEPYTDPVIEALAKHDLFKLKVSAVIEFDQKYMSYPDGKFNLPNNKYPSLGLGLEKTFGASDSGLNYTNASVGVSQRVNTGTTGEFIYRINGGAFFDADAISFADYKHFIGNQTRVGTSFDYSNQFNLLPYYMLSTNKNYAVGHFEHDFRGWILGKIPGINQLNFNLVAGAHILFTTDNQPYSELSLGIDNLGIGKFRLLRIDYVRSIYEGDSQGAFIFGLKFLRFVN